MAAQRDINGRMQKICVVWLMEVHRKYGLRRRTYFLAISNFDRYLCRRQVSRLELQLVGCCALLIASKAEEITPPGVADFVHICHNAYTTDDFQRMECTLLAALDFAAECPTVVEFLPHLIFAFHALGNLGPDPVRPGPAGLIAFAQQFGSWYGRFDDSRNKLAWYFAELASLEDQTAVNSPCHCAASALLLSNRIHGLREPWPQMLSDMTGVTESSMADCVEALKKLHARVQQDAPCEIGKRHRIPDSLQLRAVLWFAEGCCNL